MVYHIDGGYWKHFYNGPDIWAYQRSGSIGEGVHYVLDYEETIVGHNIAGFDVPAMNKLYPNITEMYFKHGLYVNDMIDTFMFASLLFPQHQEHGLEYWGKQLGREKPQHDDWSTLTPEMLHRCKEDVHINYKLFLHLQEREHKLRDRRPGVQDNFGFAKALMLEQKVQQIHAWQEFNGVRYDILKAVKLKEELDDKMAFLKENIISQAPWHVVNPYTVEVKKPYKQDGNYSKAVLDHFGSEKETDRANIRGPFSRIRFEPMNIDSDMQVKAYLLQLGWEPTEWNVSKKTRKRTSPKLTEDSYASLPPGIGRTIADYRIAAHRRGMIVNRKGEEKGGLWEVKRRGDGRVSAEAFTCGTPTSRYRHKKVVCNIPRPSSPYGKEIRELFCVPNHWWQLGLDLKGIEIRMMAHFAAPYPGGKEFIEMVLDGDFHENNGKIWSVSRDDSKPGLYGLCYGCTPPKLAAILGKPVAEGEYLYQTFWQTYPALAALRSDLERMYKMRGYLAGLDGRRLDIREDRKLLNTLVQGASAVVFKEWMVRNNMIIYERKIMEWIKQIIAYHDELQYECRVQQRDLVEDAAVLFKSSAKRVGLSFNLNVPIEADAKIGKNWAECH